MQQNLYCPTCKNPLSRKDNGYLCQKCAILYPIIDDIPHLINTNVIIDSYDATVFEYLFKTEQKHFWHVGRKEIILDFLKQNITGLERMRMIELGCGNGNVLSYLKQNGVNIDGGDYFLDGLEFCRQRAGAKGLYQVDITALPFIHNYDIIGVFDVLEHIDDDKNALIGLNNALKAGGHLLITVPAHKFLWSQWDDVSHHRRRYNKKEIKDKLEHSGFTIRKIPIIYPLFYQHLLS